LIVDGPDGTGAPDNEKTGACGADSDSGPQETSIKASAAKAAH
jgi:hypothetical protein